MAPDELEGDGAAADGATAVGTVTRTAESGVAIATTSSDALEVCPPHRYELGEEHARGGIGRVVRAIDRRLHRDVAIKQLLRPHQGNEARFVREALITARLQHPGIVPVLDAGRWTDGAPYYAMKLVEGKSLAEAIRATRTIQERIALLPHVLAVADAIAYAHALGVIHRDLKPSNVMIGDYGETVVVDWGLAKHLAAADTAASTPAPPGLTTGTTDGSWMGTPGYVPPEQVRGRADDPRVDVYALGAVLYHVLAGERPYGDGSADEIIARTLHEPPPALASIAPDAPPELVAIVNKAMAREPAGRYADATGFTDDVRRFQTGQLVRAHQYTLAQQLRRWARRNRVALVSLTGIALAGLAVFGLTRTQAIGPSCTVAERALAGAWDPATRAGVEAAFGRRKAGDVFARVDATLADYGFGWRKARQAACEATHVHGTQSPQALDLRVACLDRRKAELAALSAALTELGDDDDPWRAVGAAARLAPLSACDDTVALAAAYPPPADRTQRAEAEQLAARIDAIAAERALGRYRAAREALDALEPAVIALDHPPLTARLRSLRATSLDDMGEFEKARDEYWIAARTAAEAHDDEAVARAYIQLITVLADPLHDPAAASAVAAAAAVAVARTGDGYLAALLSQARGVIEWRRGDYAAARDHYLEAEVGFDAAPDRSASMAPQLHNDLGIVSRRLGDYAGARAFYAKALGEYEAMYGVDNPRSVSTMHNLAMIDKDQGDLASARVLSESVLAIKRRDLGEQHPDTGNTHHFLAIVLLDQGDSAAARSHFQTALEIARASYGAEHTRIANSIQGLGAVLEAEGELDGASAEYERALAMRRKLNGDEHPVVGSDEVRIGLLHGQRGDHRAALQRCARGRAVLEKSLEADNPEIANALGCTGIAHAALGRAKAAVDDLRRGVAILSARAPDGKPLAELRVALGEALWTTGQREAARAEMRAALERWNALGRRDAAAAASAWLAEH